MMAPEEHAGVLSADLHMQFAGSDWTKDLPRHIQIMLGQNTWHKPLWRERIMPPEGKAVRLKRFEDYLMLPFREGLGFTSWWAIHSALQTTRDGVEAIRLLRSEVPDYDKKVLADRRRDLGDDLLQLIDF